MTFEWPLLLWSLLLVPLALAGYLLLQRRRMRYAARFTNLDLLANVVERSPRWRRHVPPALVLLALATLLTGMARPQATVSVPSEQATVVLAMDTSGSMTATDVEPTRLAAAQDAARTFVGELPADLRVGVVGFAEQAYVAAPPTDDRDVVRAALDGLQPAGGTAIGEAIQRSLEIGARENRGERIPLVVLLLSDGANTGGTTPLEAAAEARSARVPVFTVALGTQEGTVTVPDEAGREQTVSVPPDHETLSAVAERTGGEFFDAPSGEELRSVYEELGSRVGREQEKQEITFAFIAGGAVLLLLGGTLSALWFNRIP